MRQVSDRSKLSWLDYLDTLIDKKKWIAGNIILFTLSALIISLVIPKTYTSTAVVMPSGESSELFGLSSFLSELPSISGLGGFSALSGEGVTLMAVLKSRTIQDSVINKFNLKELYKMPTMVETRKALNRHVKIAPTEEGAIEISVKAKTKYFSFGDKDLPAQQLCCEMANYYVSLLDKINKDLRMEKGKNQRIFIEKRLEQSKEDLLRAEEEFADFQKRYGVISIEEQMKASIEVIAQLKALITAKEVEIGYKSLYMDDSNRELVQARQELESMNKKYQSLLHSAPWAKDIDAIIPLNKAPDLALVYGRLYRNLMIQEKIHEFLVPMWEQAKINEAKDTPSLQVIDYAVVPDKKSSPKRALIVLLAMCTSLFFTLIYIYISTYFNHLRVHNPELYNRIITVPDELKWKK